MKNKKNQQEAEVQEFCDMIDYEIEPCVGCDILDYGYVICVKKYNFILYDFSINVNNKLFFNKQYDKRNNKIFYTISIIGKNCNNIINEKTFKNHFMSENMLRKIKLNKINK